MKSSFYIATSIMAQPIYFLLVVGALLGNLGVVWGDCDQQVQLLRASNTFQQSLNLNTMGTGEWIISESVPRGLLVAQSALAPLITCMSQNFSPLTSTTLNMTSQLKPVGLTYVVSTGGVSTPAGQPENWTWTQGPGTWRGVVLATDYDSYWFHYECQDSPLGILENAVIRTRARGTDRSLPSGIQANGEALFQSIGFNLGPKTIMGQDSC